MFARIVHFAGTPADVERAIAAYREQVLPYVRDVTGFRGQTLLVDREAGRGMSITLWASEEALLDYEAIGDRYRHLLAETWSTPVTGLETFEVELVEHPG